MNPLTPCTPPPAKYQPKGLKIIHEDKDILVVEKPSGLLTVGSDHNKVHTVHAILNDYVRKGNAKARQRVYVVHRLDQATSGLLVFAKSEAAKNFLQENWEATEKHYLAVVHGHLANKQGQIVTYLAENSAKNVYSCAESKNGKLAKTAYTVIREHKEFSLLDVHLLTGRKHQIRVHFAEIGHPLLGDQKYGTEADRAKRLLLHAQSLSFRHPFTKQLISFVSPMPEDFVRLIGKG